MIFFISSKYFVCFDFDFSFRLFLSFFTRILKTLVKVLWATPMWKHCSSVFAIDFEQVFVDREAPCCWVACLFDKSNSNYRRYVAFIFKNSLSAIQASSRNQALWSTFLLKLLLKTLVNSQQRCIQNPVKHLRWGFFKK